MQMQRLHPRVLPDLSQRPVPAQVRGSRVYVRREEEGQIAPAAPYPNEIRFLGPQEALKSVSATVSGDGRVRCPRAPARFYRPVNQLPHLPVFLIVDRATDQVQARVRGTLDYVGREASKLAAAHAVPVRDLKIILEG